MTFIFLNTDWWPGGYNCSIFSLSDRRLDKLGIILFNVAAIQYMDTSLYDRSKYDYIVTAFHWYRADF